ncbi:MAG: DUF2029 domain-containing protein [Ignavibacteria bacterium]|nr:DUF2029 domain-containing protein [Ignavibacteria bacterium]
MSFVILSSVLVWLGIIPALTRIDTDFPNYYTSSRLVIEGKDLSHLYDDDWFQDQILAYGMNQSGKFSPFPPITALIMIPLAWIAPLQALQVWTIVNIGIFIMCIVLLSKIVGKDWLWSALLFLGCGLALINNFRFGQFYLVLTFFLMLGYHSWRRASNIRSGILFGLGSAMKYFPLILLPFYIARREWKIVLTCLLTIVVMYGLALSLLGIEVHKQFLSQVIADHLAGNLPDPFSANYQSWDSLFRRIFWYDPLWNPEPVIRFTPGFYMAKYTIILSLIVLALAAVRRVKQTFGDDAPSIQFAIIIFTGMLIVPASATYHVLLLILPMGILLSTPQNSWTIIQRVMLWLFVMIGFIPYKFFRAFDGKGILTVFAYPRLGLIATLFIAILVYVWKPPHARTSEVCVSPTKT